MSATVNQALAQKTFHPYGDFLLHSMGALGDGITSGAADPTMMRTAPLWGLRVRTAFLHDGSATTIEAAILSHDGEAMKARDRFAKRPKFQQQQLVDFLKSI